MSVGGCLASHWRSWDALDVDPWVVEVLRTGYSIPFASEPPLSENPISLPSYSQSSEKGKARELEFQLLLQKGAIELAPPRSGYYSRMFMVLKSVRFLETIHRFFESQQEHC